MKASHSLLPLLATALLLPLTSATATDLGDPAPELQIKSWIQGDPVDLKDGKGEHIYVVEFWATWCPPCRASIPHLSELQAKFKDKKVTIIGVSDENAATVRPFVKRMNRSKKMDYTVAIDKDNGTFNNYMKAFGIEGIPHAFIVNREGNLVWHGHPMDGLDRALGQIVDGTYDIEAARKAAVAEQALPRYFEMVSSRNKDPKAKELGERILTDAADNPDVLNQFAWIILTHPSIKQRDLDLASQAALKAYQSTGGKDAAITDTYARALFDTGKTDEAIKLQQEAIAVCKDPELKAGLEDTLDRYRLKQREKK